ncbi:hypothetical protein AArcSl_1349 [Halalkaliarchaeum desulfuricum]|uniref:DUF8054 domain-containing protein n=1 Tax=Halalkaliarchaeum desulfuricum TaxID=2055893 RepID=A0A343TIQ8_9EURY|nr:hypothetical protein [Halalkaliarchaeum desulfuricum]AUX08980.1 hypothetical protein AArcSl_1349 [Halalkaliarchaeum desulfuricum]
MTPPTLDRSRGLHVPQGELLSSRVVTDLGVSLRRALEEALTGYVLLEPQETLLLDGDVHGVLTLEDGVPTLVYDVAADERGSRALARLADPGPYRVERYATDPEAISSLHGADGADAFRVPPGAPAEQLARDADLAGATRRQAPDVGESDGKADPLESFLADEERVAAIQEEARAEAKRRADEWGFTEEFADDR